MSRIKLPKGIHTQIRNSGRVRYYWHPGRGTPNAGPRVRLPDDPHTPEFWAALATARLSSASAAPQRLKIADMVDAYLASPRFGKLAPSSKSKYTPLLLELQKELGELHPDDLKPFNLARLRDNLAATPGRANSTLAVIGALYTWGRELGWVTQANPATGIEKLELGEHDPWTQEALDAFPEAMPANLARCCMIGLYTGQRLNDVLTMRRTAVEGSGVWVVQEKTKKQLLIPMHSAIREIIMSAADVVCPKNAKGEPFTPDQFHAAWTRMRKLKRKPLPACMKEVVFHGLRKNATVNLLEAGCTEAEVSAVTGMSLQMVVHYGKGARQKLLAREALKKLELYPGTGKDNITH